MSNDELACTYAALILADDGVTVTEDKINAILDAAGVEVEAYWPSLFARALEGCDIKELVSKVGSGAGAAAPAAAGGAAPAAAAGGAAPAAEAKKEEKKEESESEDDDMGFGLFD